MGLIGILLGLGLLILLAYRGWSVLLLAPAAALVAAAFAREPLLAHWTQTFMGSGARFIAQFFPIFLLGALFGKLMEDSGSVTAIADFMTKKLGERRAILAVVLAGAIVTYGGVSLFVASCWCRWRRRCPGGRNPEEADSGDDRTGHIHLHHVGLAGHAGDPECDPDAVLRHELSRRRGSELFFRDHAGLWLMVAWPSRGGRTAGGRGVWQHIRCDPRRGRQAPADPPRRARRDGALGDGVDDDGFRSEAPPDRSNRSSWPLSRKSSMRPSVAITCWRTCAPSRRLSTIWR